ncbi:restriction endonuclease [Streptomyces poriferorum]|uniref:restriction endonuclease n=1 Tax=Streptomyces poriferorum TaxID=2798799 RepID=UPI00273F0F52|nr:restriction endonuclease [Streptomyces sp. Alt1]WLQ48111.1 restriction endonuclease [Streptomyces sp. Alt1]
MSAAAHATGIVLHKCMASDCWATKYDRSGSSTATLFYIRTPLSHQGLQHLGIMKIKDGWDMADLHPGGTRKIHPDAYGALIEALTTINWNKLAYQQDLRRRLREHPELFARLDFTTTKRETSTQLVNALLANEHRYRDLAIELMTDISRLDKFPNLAKQVDAEDLLAQARSAVTNLEEWVGRHAAIAEERENFSAELAERRDEVSRRRDFTMVVGDLKQDFLRLHAMKNRQQAGREFETFLHRLFALFDLEPTLSYNLKGEQIDGSIYHDTNHYIVEAKWLAATIEAEQMTNFDGKVRRKGKNALGLLVSVNGFSEGGRDLFKRGTSFITMDGADVFCVLEGRIRLDELISRKLQQASRTGNCYFPAAEMSL